MKPSKAVIVKCCYLTTRLDPRSFRQRWIAQRARRCLRLFLSGTFDFPRIRERGQTTKSRQRGSIVCETRTWQSVIASWSRFSITDIRKLYGKKSKKKREKRKRERERERENQAESQRIDRVSSQLRCLHAPRDSQGIMAWKPPPVVIRLRCPSHRLHIGKNNIHSLPFCASFLPAISSFQRGKSPRYCFKAGISPWRAVNRDKLVHGSFNPSPSLPSRWGESGKESRYRVRGNASGIFFDLLEEIRNIFAERGIYEVGWSVSSKFFARR